MITNLGVVKYLSINTPSCLAELLEDIYCLAWSDRANDKFFKKRHESYDKGERK